jgi:hypothetical protein
MKRDAIQKSDIAFAKQLLTFKNNAPSYSSAVGLTTDQLKAQAADADYFNYVVNWQGIMQGGAKQSTAWKDLMRDGGTPPPTGAPVAPVFPTAVTPVAPGIEARFRALIQQIKAHPNYNEAIGDALGIEGTQQTGPDLNTLQPAIDASINGNRVEVDWGWQGNAAYLDMCEIQVDRGDGKGFVFLTYDGTPGYVDTQPFPAVPVKWAYRAIYRVNDAQVGLWSNPVSVTVPQ